MSLDHMLIITTSAMASANNEVVCSKVYHNKKELDTKWSWWNLRQFQPYKWLRRTKNLSCHHWTYHLHVSSLFAINALYVKENDASVRAVVGPNAFSRLFAAFIGFHLLEISIEDSIEKSAFSRALSPNDSNCPIISTSTDQAWVFDPSFELLTTTTQTNLIRWCFSEPILVLTLCFDTYLKQRSSVTSWKFSVEPSWVSYETESYGEPSGVTFSSIYLTSSISVSCETESFVEPSAVTLSSIYLTSSILVSCETESYGELSGVTLSSIFFTSSILF